MVQMNDKTTTVEEVKEKMREFVKKREWDEYHTPKDLSMAIATEASEIMEHFRFRNGEILQEYLSDEDNRKELSHELADVFSFLVRLSDVMGIDLAKAFEEKLEKNSERFPVETAKGDGWMAIKKSEK